jgi:hypothetical protein
MVKTIPPCVRVVKRETKVKIRERRSDLPRIFKTSPHRKTDEIAPNRRVRMIITTP